MYPRRQGRYEQEELDGRGYFTPRYNQPRNNVNRFTGNQNRQRNNMNRMNSEQETNWRNYNDGNNRQNYQPRSPMNSYNNRTNFRNDSNENSVTIQTLVCYHESKKIVQEYRKELIKDCFDSQDTIDGTLENNKIVYSCECIVKLGEIVDDPIPCPLVYNIYEKKMAELEEDCWDDEGDFALDNGVDLIERDRVEFLEKRKEEQYASVGRERAEVEAQLEQLEVEANGGSIFEMLSQRGILSQSPLPDEFSPQEEPEEMEGAIEGIVPPEKQYDQEAGPAQEAVEKEVFTEEDILRAYQAKERPQEMAGKMRIPGTNPAMMGEMNEEPRFLPPNRDPFGPGQEPMPYRMPPDYREQGYMGGHRMGMNFPPAGLNRSHDMNRDVSYVPNRYFNMFPHQQHDVFQVVDDTGRQRQDMYRVQMNSTAQQQLRQQQIDRMQYAGPEMMGMRRGPERQGMREGIPMMYGNHPNPGMDRFNHYPMGDPMFNRMQNDRHMMNYQNYSFYQGNQDRYYPYNY